MTRLLHLSDLHFGTVTPGLIARLRESVARLRPDLVAISGDLTQRATSAQFAEAAALIAEFGCPVLTVPGNHDTPLWNLWERLAHPWRRYRRAITTDLAPVWNGPGAVVAGINTANPLAWKQGRITGAQLDHLARSFADAGPRARVVVMHHPLEHLPGEKEWLMQGADQALRRLPELGAQIVLSGHVHVSHAGPFTKAPGLLFVQAGTGLSTRTRTERNAFNLLVLSPAEAEVTTFVAQETGHYSETGGRRFALAQP